VAVRLFYYRGTRNFTKNKAAARLIKWHYFIPIFLKMKCDVYVLVVLTPNGENLETAEHRGRFKWSVETSEEEALRIVMTQFTRKELRQLQSITLDPIQKPHMPWLAKKKTFDFKTSEIIKR